jgi:N-acetylated-alpha-linked acidic dipeptidase
LFSHRLAAFCCLLAFTTCIAPAQNSLDVFGYADFSGQEKLDQSFLKIPNAQLAGEHLRKLTAAPHIAGSKEDYETAQYVAEKFREAGLETSIVPYKVLLNLPQEIRIEAIDPDGKILMTGPTREHVDGDPFQDDSRIVMPFNGSSASGEVTAEVVYANYGGLEDFQRLDQMHIDIRGKIVLVRYGNNFRGVKAYIAQQRGAAGVLIYSDPADDGYVRGEKYPVGPYRPATGVQRGSVEYLFKYPGDVETPGIASTPDLPDSQRLRPEQAASQPKIMVTPISYHDAAPILEHLSGPATPRPWQGALPTTYHLGPGGVKVHMIVKQDYALRMIWDVVGTIKGSKYPEQWVIAGNHRDAWVYGAVDPNSGTAAMLEAVHGIGSLMKQGWKPDRTVMFASWDAEEEGLIGSTEWAEQHAKELAQAVAYFNVDMGVSGPQFYAAAVPSLKQFVRDVTRQVPSPAGGSVYRAWLKNQLSQGESGTVNLIAKEDVHVGTLGSGSDYTPFLQHLAVPSTDIESRGPYGVYHSAFDNYAWFTKNADPTFIYLREMAQIFGLEVLHMADAPVLPYDYVTYGHEITGYLDSAKNKATTDNLNKLDFASALQAAQRFVQAAEVVRQKQLSVTANPEKLNAALRKVESDLLLPSGLPERPWYRHAIFAPGQYTGYAAVVIPGVNEAIDEGNEHRAQEQLLQLTQALNRAASTLETAMEAPL